MKQPLWGCTFRIRQWRGAFTWLLVLAVSFPASADGLRTSPEDPDFAAPISVEEYDSPAVRFPVPLTWVDDLATRPQLSGDWHGSRDVLAEQGVTFLGDITQYYQGVTTGGLEQQFRYGVRGDCLIDFDTQRLGLWEGGHLDLRGETRLGQDVNTIDGALAPSNFAMALPRPNQNVTALTGVQYTHDVSEDFSVFAGKLNLLDGTPASYLQGKRLNYFLNTALQFNLARAYFHPSTLGAGLVVRRQDEPAFSFYLLDTHYTPTTSGFSELFTNGVLIYSEYQVRTNWFELPGHSAWGVLYSNASRTALDTNPYVLLPGIIHGAPLPEKSTSWTALYRFDQVVYVDPLDSNRSWRLNGDVGLTDGNPNPIRWFGNLSLVGSSPLRRRANDTIGLGYYHLGMSSLPVLKTLEIGSEDGVEVYYNIEVTPWFHLTPDFQVLDPARQQNSTAILVGFRGRLSF